MELKQVNIKMYKQGLGDCFLLSFHYSEKVSHILIDCGVILGTPNAEEKMKSVVNDILIQTNKKIDVAIATHEHWDHLSGFLQAEDEFKDFTIDEIWMGWTEDPNDELAIRLKQKHEKVFDTLDIAYEKIKEKMSIQDSITGFNAFFSFFGVDKENENISKRTADGKKISKTAEAFNLLKNRAESKKSCLNPGVVIENDKIPGVRFYILGPPKDEKLLKKMNPSQKNKETYLGIGLDAFTDNIFMAVNDSAEGEAYKPFGRTFNINENIIGDKLIDLNESSRIVYKEYYDPKKSWQQIDTDWMNGLGNLAIQLDNSINNTSLAIAIELIDSGKFLLFPGDAQVGNWLSWKNYIWKIKDGDKEKEITIDTILAKTVLYKVSHHGSHNATLRQDGLEKMNNKELVAMIPVEQKIAEKKRWKMPYDLLRKELIKKTKIENLIISDENNKDNQLYHEKIIANK